MLPHVLVLMAASAACSSSEMHELAARTAQTSHAKLGVGAAVVGGSERFSYHGSHQFPMQSVYKLPIAIAVLHRVEQGSLKLEQSVSVTEEDLVPAQLHSPLRDKHPKGGDFPLEDLLRRAIVDSDGSASDVLLRVLGGTKQVRRYLKEAKVKGIRVKHTEAQLSQDVHVQYEDSATPDGMVELLSLLQEGKLLNSDDTARLLQWMRESQTGKDRIRAKLPPGTIVADKTGSSGTKNGATPATNDVALIRMSDGKTLAVAIFLSDAKASTAARNTAIADIAKNLWDCWAEPR